jgi:hypothetical protein
VNVANAIATKIAIRSPLPSLQKEIVASVIVTDKFLD